jgi:glucose/arabinose dehydrogenase
VCDVRTTLAVFGAVFSSACFIFGVDVAAAADVPPGFSETIVAAGLDRPTAMAFAPDGRIFVCEQGGAVRVIKNGSLLPAPFVTLNVNDVGERGVLGIAFDPAFAVNQFVYVYYTARTPNTHNRVSRFTASGDVAAPGEVVLLDLEPLGATNHNGGAIHFGPDGKLYVAVGDNAVDDNAQTLANRLGKMLRINADGSIPPDNPFASVAVGVNRAIWALGLRNPFTFAFQPLSGRMIINDVGENTWEEINPGLPGANYGWPDTEGPTSDPDFVSPLRAYTHANGCAIAGGAFHHFLHPNFPFEYWGAYFFADLCGGWIRALRTDGTVLELASGINDPVDLKVASDGTLYYLARGGGIVARIAYTSAAPRIDVTANGSDGPLSLVPGNALRIDQAFEAGSAGPINAAEVYIGLVTPSGLFWLDPNTGFTRRLARLYAGTLPTFEQTLGTIPDVDALAPGHYLWFILVDDTVNGIPEGDFSDFVLTTIQ